jgi:hypothetical protein
MTLKFIVAVAMLAAVPLCAQAQGKAKKPTIADAENVVKLISADKAKMKAYCDLSKLGEPLMQAEQKKDTKKVDELSKQADALAQQLGPEYAALMDGLQELDDKAPEGEAIGKTLDGLDKLCAK